MFRVKCATRRNGQNTHLKSKPCSFWGAFLDLRVVFLVVLRARLRAGGRLRAVVRLRAGVLRRLEPGFFSAIR